MTPIQLLAAATSLLDGGGRSQPYWGRAAALLLRQALEGGVALRLRARAPGATSATFAAQLLVLAALHPDPALARKVGWAWAALTRACHADDLGLPPTVDELRGLAAVAGALLDAG